MTEPGVYSECTYLVTRVSFDKIRGTPRKVDLTRVYGIDIGRNALDFMSEVPQGSAAYWHGDAGVQLTMRWLNGKVVWAGQDAAGRWAPGVFTIGTYHPTTVNYKE
jgi:hypothetical protein